MTLPIERSRTRRPVTWLTLIGLLLLPAVVGGILVTALYNPVERLDALTAAVVNDDEPVTIDDQYVPLGRQLTAGLVEGSDDIESNLTWVVSNTEDAEAGLANGRYAAVVTIPADFSAAATSTRPGETPHQAVIEVQTSPDALIVDDAITAQVTQAAASLMGQELSKVYLENVLLGFTTLGNELGTAAGGAGELADGTRQLADGTRELADGTGELATGTAELADGTRQLADGSAQLPAGATQLANGAYALSGGAGQLAGGLDRLTAGVGETVKGTAAMSSEVRAGAAQLEEDGIVPDKVFEYVAAPLASTANAAEQIGGVAVALGGDGNQVVGLAQRTGALAQDAGETAESLVQLAATCAESGASTTFCDQLANAAAAAGTNVAATGAVATDLGDAARDAGAAAQTAIGAATDAGYADGVMKQFAKDAPVEIAKQFRTIADGVDELGAGLTQLQAGAGQSADGARQLASGAGELGAGGDQLASGAGELATGIGQLANGTSVLASGSRALADGTTELADGTGTLADGSSALAEGLTQATDAIPSYTDAEARSLASVVAAPVTAEGEGTSLFGASAVPLLATLALWFGGLASFVVLRASSTRVLTSRAPSAVLALRSLAPAAGIGALQGLLVAIVVQFAAGYEWGPWWVFTLVAVVAGIGFAAVNQALVAVFGGAGRWISALIGVLAVATGVVSTVPGVLSQFAAVLPTAPAYNAMLAALGPASGVAAGLVGLLVWALLAMAATVLAVARRRTTSARELLTASA